MLLRKSIVIDFDEERELKRLDNLEKTLPELGAMLKEVTNLFIQGNFEEAYAKKVEYSRKWEKMRDQLIKSQITYDNSFSAFMASEIQVFMGDMRSREYYLTDKQVPIEDVGTLVHSYSLM